MRKLTTEEFVDRANKVHNYKYDYSKSEYITTHVEVCIICPVHGEFKQTPSSHLRGRGCPYCANNVNLTTEIFVNNSKKVHENKYDYSKVNYINSHTSVCIICPIHGEFPQTPHNHMHGWGCRKCAGTHKYSTKEWVDMAKLVHGDDYNYDDVEYIDAKHCVNIKCNKCNKTFCQTPYAHISGNGCPYCRTSRLEKHVQNLLNEFKVLFYKNYRGFDWLKNKFKLELDFYLPEYNIAIECQGIQHFEPRVFLGGEKQYIKLIDNDNLKKKLCYEHNLPLYYVNYNSVENDIKNLIKIINK